MLLQQSMNCQCHPIVVLDSSVHEWVNPAVEWDLGVADANSQ